MPTSRQRAKSSGALSVALAQVDMSMGLTAVVLFVSFVLAMRVMAESVERAAAEAARDASEAERRVAADRAQAAEAGLVASKRELSEAESRLRATASNAEAERRALAAERDRLKAIVEGRPVDFVVCVDVSSSMTQALVELKRTVAAIAELAPRFSPEFRIGIVAYRSKVFATLPLTRVDDPRKAGDKSLRPVKAFLDGLRPVSEVTDFDAAIRAGAAMLDAAGKGDRRQVLAVLSDVGPYEGGVDASREPAEVRLENEIEARLKAWCRAGGGDRRVLCVVAKDSAAAVASGTQPDTVAFFRRLAAAAPNGAFAETNADMLKATIEATLAD